MTLFEISNHFTLIVNIFPKSDSDEQALTDNSKYLSKEEVTKINSNTTNEEEDKPIKNNSTFE